MHQLDLDLARATILARLTTAKDARLARQVRLAAREARRERRGAGHNLSADADLRPAAPSVPPVDDLELILAGLAERVVEHGTRAEMRALHAVAAAARDQSPGAAQALLDWQGAEVARLRAFGILAGAVLRLNPGDRQQLADDLLGGGPATTITDSDAVPAVEAVRPGRRGRRRSVRRWAW